MNIAFKYYFGYGNTKSECKNKNSFFIVFGLLLWCRRRVSSVVVFCKDLSR